ncbi:MAG: cupredoxin domain-containing protein, partial [Acidobacteriota bacterium]
FKYTPARIRVAAGTRLEIELSSRDVVHGFEIPSAGIETKIPSRGRGSVKVVYLAEKKGKIPFRCSHQCGAGHASMRGMIIVE